MSQITLRILCFLCAFSFYALPQQAVAQSASLGNESALVLRGSEDSYEVVPHIYQTKDMEGRLNWQSVLQRHQENIRGKKLNDPILNLSFDNAVNYFVFTVQNSTVNNDWLLDFGSREDGRMGMITSIYIYDATSGVMILDGFKRLNGPSGIAENLHGTVVPLTIPKNEKRTYLIYMITDNSLPVTLPISIKPQAAFMEASTQQDVFHFFILACFMAATGFFIGMLLINPHIEHLFFALYFAAQLGLYHGLDINFFTGDPMISNIIGILIITINMLMMWLTRFFLDMSWKNDAAMTNFFYILLTIAFVGGGAFVLYGLSPYSPLRPILFFTPALITPVIVIITCLSRLGISNSGAGYFTLGWAALLVGSLISASAFAGFVMPSQYLINAYWYCLLPQVLLFVTATALKFRGYQDQKIRQELRQNQEAESMARLRQSKESADQQRLLRVLEREREVMEELRQREAQRTEEMRVAKEAADEANRAKSAFLAVISHEIRTPMTGIMGMVRLILDTQLTKQQNEYATTIQESGNTMLALLNDILDFEKIETGKMDIEIVPFDLQRLLKSVVTLMSGRAKEHNIALEIDLDKKVPTVVEGDPTRMRQILLNLVGNAIKFTSEGSVTLQVKRTGGSEDGTLHDIYFGIKDTGIGISEEAQKNLFNPFSQADRSISRKFGGSGLGLAICKRLIEAMSSQIHLHSVEGEGSTFYFTLHMPSADKSVLDDTGAGNGEGNIAKMKIRNLRILIAEDNEINQKVLMGFLEKDQHIIDFVNDGEKAVQKAKTTLYDVIFTDIEMPLLKGTDVAKQIREMDGPNKNTPIIAMTGNVGAEDIQSYRDVGMDDHLGKPINPDLLRGILAKIASGEFGEKEQPALIVEEAAKKPVSPFAYIEEEPATANDTDDDVVTNDDNDIFGAHSDETPDSKEDTEPMLDKEFFDENMLIGLKESVGNKQLLELLDGLYQKTEELIDAIKTARANDNIEELHARSHELKGMAGNFGLKKISALAKEIEIRCKEKNLEGTEDFIEKMPNAYDASKKLLADWIK